MAEEVVVSAGEPVAWKIETDALGTWFTQDQTAARISKETGRLVADFFASAPVVLPETPPADLIEQMAKADHRSTRASVDWPQLREEVRSLYRHGAHAQYAVLRSWVAGGGETR